MATLTTEPAEGIRGAIQRLLDADGDHWHVAEHVVVMALERVTPDGIESVVWCWSPPDQPSWKNSGLLHCASDLIDNYDTDMD